MPDARRLSPEISWFPPRLGGAGALVPTQQRDWSKACPFQVSARGLVPSFKILGAGTENRPLSPPVATGLSKVCLPLSPPCPALLSPGTSWV
jgi:hypothetical protein